MPPARSLAAPIALAILASTSVTNAEPPTPAAFLQAPLEHPPQLVTFKLDDPTATRLTLLDAFHESLQEHPARLPRYLTGAFARWGRRPWWTFAWFPHDAQPPAPDTTAAPVADEHTTLDALPFELDDQPGTFERLFGFEPRERLPLDVALPSPSLPSPSWLERLDPAWFAPLPPSSSAAPIYRTPFATFASNGADALWSLPPKKPLRDWRCRRRPVTFVRAGGESDAFELVRCDGKVAPEAFDRLTLIARTNDARRPGPLLPDEPDPEAQARGEWSPGVHLVHPRLLWALQRIADAFPWRAIYVYSGYRPKPANAKPNGHHSLHGEARAMDISVMGVPNASLFQVCRGLDDVGCGFYPNSKFVHVDIRRTGTGHAFWIDTSRPGEPSNYVDSWAGVVDGGALVWDPSKRDADAAAAANAGVEASCTGRSTGR